ncbi:hypothetical protein, partial [Burkholderia cepacia]|uniref:hypothetical protein n=1 Tax=Burkholderia cepacia TaxID=292 RepID=UPI001D00217D
MKPAVSLFVLSAAMVGAFHAAALSAAPMPAVPASAAAASGAMPAPAPSARPVPYSHPTRPPVCCVVSFGRVS